MSSLTSTPEQQLPKAAYTGQDWFERERESLWGCAWTYAGNSEDLAKEGDYLTLEIGAHRLFVLRTDTGLKAFHNLCRHRGTELLEGRGNLGAPRIVCPYHRWTYSTDGSLKALPMKSACFPELDQGELSLREASTSEFKEMIFVHPNPREDFEAWLAGLGQVAWPHAFDDMTAQPEVTYELRCNWKIFVENAIDGYHLAYLHDKTLGGPRADKNIWVPHGRHLVWYSEESGKRTCLPEAVASQLGSYGSPPINGADSCEYGGVYMIFPTTIVTAGPTDFAISRLVPVAPDVTLLIVRSWRSGSKPWRWLHGDGAPVSEYPGYDPESGYLKLEKLLQHPLETGDFQWEDVWVCEKMQRSMRSPVWAANRLAQGAGAEAPLDFFQKCVLDCLGA